MFHTGETNRIKQRCGKRLTEKADLDKYSEKARYRCQELCKMFSKKSEFNKQTLTHTGERNIEWEVYGKLLV